MKKKLFLSFAFLLLISSCGSTTSDDLNIEEIRERLDRNSCSINREEAILKLTDFEYVEDTLFTEIPQGIISDSLLACPVTSLAYLFITDGDHRKIACPSGHGETSF
jgi:hypothetical protein